ncbi:hypothetical protein JAAARDRAFT_198329 [Jaapia argillacea MUCL 33604]|uniref:Uncharacterized protein n=1 Tax=Jaapia argillacea MUCL 33604 TaxID=933084 RepID=A0A067PF23_9AGAM|nr:hypothetical protein JAAARDRAFT_198329 [Jaapia argillacea MUCL 33604]
MISQAMLHTLSVVLTPSIHLPAPPSFYVTANNQVMTHNDIEYCERQLMAKILNNAHLVNPEHWILKWNCNQQEEIHVHMGCPQALDFFETDSPSKRGLDFSEAFPESLCPLLPIIQTKPVPEAEEVFGAHPLLLEDAPSGACSLSYHLSTPIHSPHPSDYQPMADMEIDKWNSRTDCASPPLIPIDASSSDNSLPSLQPLSSTTSSESLPPLQPSSALSSLISPPIGNLKEANMNGPQLALRTLRKSDPTPSTPLDNGHPPWTSPSHRHPNPQWTPGPPAPPTTLAPKKPSLTSKPSAGTAINKDTL